MFLVVVLEAGSDLCGKTSLGAAQDNIEKFLTRRNHRDIFELRTVS